MRGKDKKVVKLIDRFVEGLSSAKMNVEEGERIIRQLQGLADDAVPRIVDLLEFPEQEKRRAALVLLRELGDTRAVGPLRRILRHPDDHSDEEKMGVIHTLEILGAPIDEATFRRAISDPDALMQNSMEQMLATIEDPIHVEAFLEMMGEAPPEMLALYVQDMLAPFADRRLLLLLTALLHSDDDDVIITAIDAIERMKEPATIPILAERAKYDPSTLVRHTAENAALRLEVRIGAPDEEHTSFWFTASSLPLNCCLLCTIDGSGGQVLLIAREQPDGELQMLDLMFNDHEGIKDCFTALVDEDELDEMTDSFGSSEFVDVSLARARAEAARAYQVTLEAGRRLPPAFVVWQGELEGEDARQIEEFPLPTLKPSQQEELLVECVELLNLDEFDFWFFNPDEVEPFVSRYRELFLDGLAEEGDVEFEALLDEAIESLIDEEYRRLLANRLSRQAWLLAQLYEEEEVSLWLLVAASALEEGIVVEHPLMRDMMDRSLLNAVGRYR
ncbi:MAG: HEAT repeat domain-containing protein [Chloroflexota bacterium]|nr:HEAT repeat domain-containing protein [Chloroflexota bacterium]